MKANELRIGNWVNDESNTMPYQIRPNDIFPLSMIENKGKAKPIPLTPEILGKAGFEKEPKKIDIYSKSRIRLWVGFGGRCLAYLIEEGTTTGHYIPNDIDFVHQLQNLYFTLTGEELQISM